MATSNSAGPDIPSSQQSPDAERAPKDLIRAAIYARVSTKEQAEGKASIPDQLHASHNVVREKQWAFFAEYRDDGISGHLTEERHGLQSMLRDARAHKFDLIVVKDFDRFARDKDAAAIIRKELKDLGIQTFAINTPVDPRAPSQYDPDEDDLGTIVETISDMRADLERKQIARRMKMGKLARAKAGSIPNRVPYGYEVKRTVEGSKIKRAVVVNEADAAKVRFIYESYAGGWGTRKIVILLNGKGWQSPHGGQWNIASLRYLLANPTYAGKVWWGWRHASYKKTRQWRIRGKAGYVGQGSHPPIIDPKLFDLVQEVRVSRAHGCKGGTGRSLGLLTGIAKCIRCGNGVGYQKRHHSRSAKNPNWNDTTTFEYICTGYKYKGLCSQRVMSAGKLESVVLDHVRNIYGHPRVQESLTYDGNDREASERARRVAQLETEISLESTKMLRQHEAYERRVISLDEYEANLLRIREQNTQNRMERDHLLSQSSLTTDRAASISKLLSLLKDFDVAWNKMDLSERKAILRGVIREIRAGNNRVEIDFHASSYSGDTS